jgi:hypothetical protein
MAMKMESEDTLRKLAMQAATKPEALAERVLSLQTADKFRLAGLLLDAGMPRLAEAVGVRACQEIQRAMLFATK